VWRRIGGAWWYPVRSLLIESSPRQVAYISRFESYTVRLVPCTCSYAGSNPVRLVGRWWNGHTHLETSAAYRLPKAPHAVTKDSLINVVRCSF
jgi:hypothetical protein